MKQTIRILNRLSFRILYNPLYEQSLFDRKQSTPASVHIYLVVPKASASDASLIRATYPSLGKRMGDMQRAFTLQVIRSHYGNLSKTLGNFKHNFFIHLQQGDIKCKTLKKWSEQGDEIWLDVVPDPTVPRYTSVKNIARVCTSELIDWTVPGSEANTTLIQFCKGPLQKSPYASTAPLKQFAVGQLQKRVKSKRANASTIIERADTQISNSPYMKQAEIKRHESSLQRLAQKLKSQGRIFPKIPTKISVPKLVRAAISGAKGLCKVWKKPDTSPAARWGSSWNPSMSKTSRKGNHCCITTQLSPWLAIGAISPLTVWESISCKSNHAQCTSVQSLKGQLLWREAFHAIGHAALSKQASLSQLRVAQFWKRPEMFAPSWYNTNSVSRDLLKRWMAGDLKQSDGAPFRADPEDTNASMKQLMQTGWIHHLQRHLVASVLTRPKNSSFHGLGQHWKWGEAVFRAYLIDHDACINRANYMWLAAVAFSAKLKSYRYAYREDDYIQRRISRCRGTKQ